MAKTVMFLAMLSRGSKFEPYHTMIYVYVLDFALLCLVEFQQAK